MSELMRVSRKAKILISRKASSCGKPQKVVLDEFLGLTFVPVKKSKKGEDLE